MKKIVLILVLALLLLNSNAYCVENSFVDLRNKIFDESNQIKALLATSRMPVLVTGLWDICVITTVQLDAYFYMLGIFNNVPKGKAALAAVDYLFSWLSRMKSTNSADLNNIGVISKSAEADIQPRIKTLTSYLAALGSKLDAELNRISLLKQALK